MQNVVVYKWHVLEYSVANNTKKSTDQLDMEQKIFEIMK